jgi:hypothetical protein
MLNQRASRAGRRNVIEGRQETSERVTENERFLPNRSMFVVVKRTLRLYYCLESDETSEVRIGGV